MSEIYLIRHGQASLGAENYDRLSETGVIQAKVLGKHLAGLNISFDAICFGQMDRQQKTAQGMIDAYREMGLGVPEPVVDKSFNEYDAESVWKSQVGQLLKEEPTLLAPLEKDPKNNAAFQKIFSKVDRRWVSGNYDAQGDITWKDFKTRVTQGLWTLTQSQGSSKRIAVFSSAGPICAAVQAALNLSDMKAIELSWQVMNASVTRLVYGKGRIGLAGFNDVTPLALTGDKGLLTYR